MLYQILVPLDGSQLAERALPYATALAGAMQARLVLLRATDAFGFTDRGRSRAQMAVSQDAETYLNSIAGPLRERGLTVDLALPVGGAAETIEDEITLRDIDLVVMATHGRSGLGRLVYGSVAAHVLHAAKVPVLVVRAWQKTSGTSFTDSPRIVVPVDGSHFAAAALPIARELVTALGGQLLLVMAVSPPEVAMMSELAYAQFDPASELATATAYLEQLAEGERAAGRPTQTLAQVGMPEHVIGELARSNDAALIVMATHGRGGVGRFVMGSVADATLRQGTTPLLLVRPHGDELGADDSGTTATSSVADPK